MRRRLHLLEVGVRWPPETFLGWKYEGLVERGLRVTVASRQVFDRRARLSGVRLVALCPGVHDGARRYAVVARDGLLLALTSPRRLVRLLLGIRRCTTAEERRARGGTVGVLAGCLRLARLRPDVVHFEWQEAAARHLPLFDVWRCPIVTSCHGPELGINPYVPAFQHYHSRLPDVLRKAGAVHCVSERLREQAIAFGLDPAKAWVIRQGVDTERFAPQATNGRPRALRVTTVGWLRWMKGLEYALEAIRALVDRGIPVELHVLGGPPGGSGGEVSERHRAVHTVEDLGLGDVVHLHGYVDSAEVARRVATSDLLMHPSVSEGLPTVVIEAMACGVPVVATDCGGTAEAVTDGVEGLVVPVRDADALADALTRLWADPALRARLGAAGRARVRRDFTLDRHLGEMERMYRTVAA